MSCNGRPRNIIAALGYLTWVSYTISHRELTQGVLESYQSIVFRCYLKSAGTTAILRISRVSRFVLTDLVFDTYDFLQ